MDSTQTSVMRFIRSQRHSAILFLLLWSGFAIFEVASDWYSFGSAGWPFSPGRHTAQSAFIFYPWFLLSLAIGILMWRRPHYLDSLRGYAIHAALAVTFSLAHLLIIVASFRVFFPRMLLRSSFGELFIEQFLNWFHFELLVYFAVLFTWRIVLQKESATTVTPRRQRLVGRIDGEVHIATPESIDWIEAANNHVIVHAGERRIRVRETLKSLEARLDPGCFVRVHRSALVNADRLHHIEDAQLVMADGSRVTCSRGGRRALKQLLQASRH